MRKKLAAGNWKMNGLSTNLAELSKLCERHPTPKSDLMIAPAATLIASAVVEVGDHAMAIGAQDCHPAASGAHTGDISAEMLRDAGASYVIVGHSERRADHRETDAQVLEKSKAAHRAGLIAVVCIGETLKHRETNSTLHVVGSQLEGSLPAQIDGENTVIAYEPVWAIGTGKIPTLDEIAEVHDFIRSTLSNRYGAEVADTIRLLYGGSVKPGNAAEIFAVSNVDGALVGGASLKADDFSGIITALDAA